MSCKISIFATEKQTEAIKRHDSNALISNLKMKKTIGFKQIMDFEKLKNCHVKHLKVITKNRRVVPTAGRIIDTTKNYIKNHAASVPPRRDLSTISRRNLESKGLTTKFVAPPWIA